MSVDTHVRINLKSVAERLNMSEAQLARSVSASMPRFPPAPPMSGPHASPGKESSSSQHQRSFPTTPQDGPVDVHAEVPALSQSEFSTPNVPLLGNLQRSPGNTTVGSIGRPRAVPVPKPSAPIRVGGAPFDYGSAADVDDTPPASLTQSRGGHLTSGSYRPVAPMASTPSATVLVSSVSMRSPVGGVRGSNASAAGRSLNLPPRALDVRSAVTRYASRDEALGVPSQVSQDYSPPPSPSGPVRRPRPGTPSLTTDDVYSDDASEGSGPPATTETFASHAEVQGPADLLLSTNAEGRVELAFVARDPSPSSLARQDSRLTRQESRLTRQESRLTRGGDAASETRIPTPETSPAKPKRERKTVHFPTEPISQVTIFQTQDAQVVLQVQYRRPGWCLGVGAIAGVLRAAVWALASHALYTHIRVAAPEGEHWETEGVAAHIQDNVRENVAIMLRIGFEIYCGCAVLFACVMLIFWRPSRRDLKSLHTRREQKRLAICVISGAVGRLCFVLSLGLAISATYVGLHHAMPLIWVVAYRSRRRKRTAAYPDLLASGTLCAALAVMCAGDMQEFLFDWEVSAKWCALPLVVFSSLLRGLQRYRTKSLKAHFSFRLMLLTTMCADSVTMLIAALAADANCLSRIAEASSDEAVSAGLAILCMTFAVISDVLLAKYFDIVSGLSLTALTLPAAAAFFRAFTIGAPDVTYIMISALLAILSTVIALGSGEVNRRTKNLVLGEDEPQQMM